MGKNFDIPKSISRQLPFFSCMNIALDKQCQKDISKFLYCKEFNIPPFKGDYGDQSNRWINKVNIIKSYIAKIEQAEYKKQESNHMRENRHV